MNQKESEQKIEVRVRFFGPIRTLAGRKEQVVMVSKGATLRDLLEELKRVSGSELGRYIVVQGNGVNPVLLVSLNGETIDEIQSIDVKLPDRSVLDVMLVVPVAGGQGV